ncbi:unknown protein [Parachlamydia acanthamoebae UV-7]|uniref:Uncharacterized protein n=2 Tax=Parachlamydia acanthamoebae TaxID=83552 RepID=F8KVY9_PARAV|nr:hypothetical protein DB43_AP00150 [Parachlamydia acanthamoebae]CCB85289.1 unknown protein [Parachlamydia acanthamoebae UV-7]
MQVACEKSKKCPESHLVQTNTKKGNLFSFRSNERRFTFQKR